MNVTAVVGTLLVAGATMSIGFAAPDVAAPNAAATATSATGDGTMSFGHEEEGRAYLRFDIDDPHNPSGSLLFAAEHHHERFPDVVIELGNIAEVDFGSRSVKFSGPGRLHDDPVTVAVAAYDNDGEGEADRFVIECTDPSGETVFEADGELFRGDISIGGAS